MESHFYVVQERDYYKVTSWSPVEVNHSNFRIGRTLGDLKTADAELTVATSGIGMLGYYSRVPIIDLVGLTDAHVAHQPLEKRGRPGHEKWAERLREQMDKRPDDASLKDGISRVELDYLRGLWASSKNGGC